jgi:hypothetical protein
MHRDERLSKIRPPKIPEAAGTRYAFTRPLVITILPPEENFHMLHLIRRHLSTFVLAQFFLLTSAAQTVWQPFTDEEAGFTVNFPGKPSYEEGSLSQNGDPEETYKFQYGDNFLWVKFAPLSGIPRDSVGRSRMYAQITRDFSKAGTLVRQEKLPDGGRQYYNVEDMSSGRLHMLTRVYLHRGRQYHLIYGTFAPAGVDERLASRFFSSFRFIEPSRRRGASARTGLPNGGSRADTQRSEWYVLRGSDGDFVAEFPDRPEHSVTPQPEIGTDVHKFRFFFGETLLVLSYWEVPEGMSESGQALQRVVNNHVAGERAKGQVQKQMALPGGGYEVESRGVFNNTLLHSRVRFYLRGTRIYSLTAMSPNSPGPSKDDIEKFFASFRLKKP